MGEKEWFSCIPSETHQSIPEGQRRTFSRSLHFLLPAVSIHLELRKQYRETCHLTHDQKDPQVLGFLFGVHVYGTSQVLPCGRNVFLWSSTKAITPKSSTTSTKSDKQLCYVICSIGSLGDFQAACCWVNEGYVVCCNSIGYRLYTRVVSCCSVWVKTKKDMYFFDSISKDSALLETSMKKRTRHNTLWFSSTFSSLFSTLTDCLLQPLEQMDGFYEFQVQEVTCVLGWGLVFGH